MRYEARESDVYDRENDEVVVSLDKYPKGRDWAQRIANRLNQKERDRSEISKMMRLNMGVL